MLKKYAKLINGVLNFAPENKQNILNYNRNEERMRADGYKPVEFLSGKPAMVSPDGRYDFGFVEEENCIKETSVFTPYSYAEKRAQSYPDFRNLLDSVVKINSGNEELAAEGREQQQAYVNACLAVKAAYPKI